MNHCSIYLFARKALTVGVCDKSCDRSFVTKSVLISADISSGLLRDSRGVVRSGIVERSNDDSGTIDDPIEGAVDPRDPNSASLKPFWFILEKITA